MEEPSGFLGLETRLWRAAFAVEAWDQHPAGSGQERVAIPTGTDLHLDQTDWCFQGCTPADVIVGQRFTVLDGPLAGRCVEFTAYAPEAFVSWVPDGLVAAAATTTSGRAAVTNRS